MYPRTLSLDPFSAYTSMTTKIICAAFSLFWNSRLIYSFASLNFSTGIANVQLNWYNQHWTPDSIPAPDLLFLLAFLSHCHFVSWSHQRLDVIFYPCFFILHTQPINKCYRSCLQNITRIWSFLLISTPLSKPLL